MNYKKIILVGCISAFVAILTSVLGVAGTVIGSVISSVLYNTLSEMLEQPVEQATFSHKFEWEVAYVFPLAVIALIQLLLIFALLSEAGILPHTFLSVFLSLQNLANNNLYRILGVAMLIISVYPLVLKPDIIKKVHGVIIAFVGIIFLARGFVDLENRITNLYDVVFTYFDLPIAIIALVLIVYVIVKILLSARGSEKEFRITKHKINEENFSKENASKKHHSKKHEDFEYNKKREDVRTKNHEKANMEKYEADVQFKKDIDMNKNNPGINESFDNIQFESNDLLDDYKK
jgi:hypothetical protein